MTTTTDHLTLNPLTGEATIVTGEGEDRRETPAVYIPWATVLAAHAQARHEREAVKARDMATLQRVRVAAARAAGEREGVGG